MVKKRITWQIEKRKLADLKPHSKNPRQFTDKGMKDLENSINSIGFMQPININQDGTILSGHARTLKLKEMGETEVDVYVPDRMLTPKQEEEVLVRANANTAGQWDFEILANEFDIDEINEWGLEVPDMEVEELEAKEDDFDAEPPVNPKTVLGDLYEIGEHRLLCGDSTCSDTVAKLMNGKKANMVFTDPPYGISYDSKDSKHEIILNDDTFLFEWMPQVLEHSKGFIFMWTSYQVVGKWISLTKNYFGDITNMIIWHKGGGGLGDLYKRFSTDFEIALVWNRGETLKGKRIGSVWQIAKDNTSSYQHPTQKPIELMSEGLSNCSLVGNIIMDLFLGSGSTMVASHQLKRKCYGMELDPKYCDVIIKRMIKLDPSLKITRNGEDCKNEFIENND